MSVWATVHVHHSATDAADWCFQKLIINCFLSCTVGCLIESLSEDILWPQMLTGVNVLALGRKTEDFSVDLLQLDILNEKFMINAFPKQKKFHFQFTCMSIS